MDLGRWLDRDDLTIEALVETAGALLADLVPEQTRYKVNARPDVRTVRYYTSQRLLPKPLGYDAGRARYSGTHLLRLLLIKRMQAEHQTLQRIRTVLADATDAEVLDALSPDQVAPRATGGPAESEVRDLSLSPGGRLRVARSVLADPDKRRQLAENLESLADWLRTTAGEVPDDSGDDP